MSGLALTSGKQDLVLDPPVMNSAGVLGFDPDMKPHLDLSRFGAFVTHPVSLRPRHPASQSCFQQFPGGVLLHTGWPNPGLRDVIKDYKSRWEAFDRPVILHLLAEHQEEMKKMVDVLDSVAHPIQALEIGLAHQITAYETEALIKEGTLSQLPILARIPPDADGEILQAAQLAGANAIVIGPPRGSLAAGVSGRLYGPGLLPQSFQQLERFLACLEIPVILGCGLYTADDVRLAFQRGAAAVQLDTMLWLNPRPVIESLSTSHA